MEDAQLAISIEDRVHQQGKTFFDFLKRAARKHCLRLSVSSDCLGRFTCSVPRKEVQNFELFLQELIFNHALYYYLCTLPNRADVARLVVRPIFQQLLEFSFNFWYPSLIRKHVLNGAGGWVAGEFSDALAQRYEALFWRLKLKMISGYEFIRDLDDILTEFMLQRLGYKKGQKSLKFNLLVDECARKGIIWEKDVRKRFNRVHILRTRGLHRLERDIPESEISQIALQMYFTFEYINDYFQAQHEKTVVLGGKRYRRIRWGSESRHWKYPMPEGYEVTWSEVIKRPCGDCGVLRGELHLDGCDIELCPCCAHQYLCCGCKRYWDDEEDADGFALVTQVP